RIRSAAPACRTRYRRSGFGQDRCPSIVRAGHAGPRARQRSAAGQVRSETARCDFARHLRASHNTSRGGERHPDERTNIERRPSSPLPQPYAVGESDYDFARSLERLSAVGGADVVHDQHIAGLPRLTYGVGLVRLVDHLDDIGADRVAVAEARVERLAVRAVDVHEVLAYVGRQRPLVEECDLVEPAAPPGQGMPHDGVAALPRAQATAIPPLEVDRVGATVALHGAAVVRAEYVGAARRSDEHTSDLQSRVGL